MYEAERQAAARAVRREMTGEDDTPVDPTVPEGYRDHLTAMAWGAWARGGPLSLRDRSLATAYRMAPAGSAALSVLREVRAARETV